ncbi:uncharacterized protein LOC121735535 [Aricia agestis]|uniref:uncharacterized protein LOC121735535 n=1 Tax=Aricia agestis TaxID=91739 RepID=UPI001C20746F|nr:uncharacterized protein LOC121735535 [Aricia agestis]
MAPEIDITMLIQEIRNRPGIYDTSKAEYRNKHLKSKLWEEVCCNIYSAPVWTSLTSKEKTKYRNDIQLKWNSLRSCFRRDLSAQKNTPSGSGRKKKRKYIYFDLLLFLLPFTAVENNEPSIEIEQSAESLYITVQNSHTESTDFKRPKTQPKSRTNSDDEEYLETLREGNQLNNNLHNSENRTILGDIDEDESFLRSLLPYVKQFSPDQKLQLRIQLLQTVLNFKNSLSSSEFSHNQIQQVLDVPNEHRIAVTDSLMDSNMSNQNDTAERPNRAF